jgi:hypothetical protein
MQPQGQLMFVTNCNNPLILKKQISPFREKLWPCALPVRMNIPTDTANRFKLLFVLGERPVEVGRCRCDHPGAASKGVNLNLIQ